MTGERDPHQPPAFPSVGGNTDLPRPADSGPIATSADDKPLLPAFASADGAAAPTTEPVGGRNSRWRWFAAGVATLAVLALVGGFLLFFTPRAGTPSLVSEYAPGDSAVYAEVRLDLPGDQRDRLMSFLGKFPGFADPATFQQKLDDTLRQAFNAADTGLDWTTDVQPWFGGQVGVFSSTIAPTPGTPPSMTIVLSVKDRAKLDELLNARLGPAGMQQEDYKNHVVWTGNAAEESRRVSLSVTADALVVSTRNEDLKRALDVRSGEVAGLIDDTFVSQQLAALHSDRLAAFYFDYGSMLDATQPPFGMLPPACLDDIRNAARIKLLGEVRAENDHLAVTMRSQIPSGANLPPAPANRRSVLVNEMPPTSVAYLEMRQLGVNIGAGISQFLSCAGPAGGGIDLGQFEQLLGTSVEDYFDFLDDAAVALTFDDGKFGGGLIATVDDTNVAATRVERLLSAARLLAFTGGVTFDEVQHGDATLTVIRFENQLIPEQETPSVSITVSGGRVYIGLDDFVVDALDRADADSLGASPRLQSALSAAGAENAGFVYVDITALRTFAEGFVPANDRARYETEAKPFIQPLTHLIVVNRTEGSINIANTFLYVE